MAELPASVLAAFMPAAPDMGDTGAFLLDILRRFPFRGDRGRRPHPNLHRSARPAVGHRPVQLIDIGPAHTAGDVIVHVPATPERHRRA
jgi:hypothetical protein